MSRLTSVAGFSCRGWVPAFAGTTDRVTYVYNTANELTTMTENGVDTTFTYNDWGRTVSKQKTVGQTTYTAAYAYRFGDKLKTVTTDFPGEQAVYYNYDGLGKRRNKETPSDAHVTWYRWDAGWGLLAEYAGASGSWTVGDREMSYTLLGMLALADVPGTNPSTGTYRYYAQDHLGSFRALFDGDKASAGTAEYEPYGMIRTGAGPAELPGQLFTGKTLDLETMLYYFPFRYYSPMSARWMTRDPLGMVDGPNVCTYVANDPISGFDPEGLFLLRCNKRFGRIRCALYPGWKWYSNIGCCKKTTSRCHDECEDKYERQVITCGLNPFCRAKIYTELRACYLVCSCNSWLDWARS